MYVLFYEVETDAKQVQKVAIEFLDMKNRFVSLL